MPIYDSTFFSPPGPLARVEIRSQNDKRVTDVPMLIDSGSDLTLLPAAFVEQLGPNIAREPDYELEAFDGSTTISSSVRLELNFLDHRFTGRFVLLDSPYGILGRNVLNHLALVLDGPNLTWNRVD